MKLALLGHPLGHSLSPAMHNAALQAVGLTEWAYALRPAPAEALAAVVADLRGADHAGANVTVPHKQAVMAYLDGLTPVAQAIGAVNTLFKQNGALLGHNTDAAGLLADLHRLGVAISGRAVLLLGAGGAARAAVAACAGVGAEVRVAARRPEQAAALAGLISAPQTLRVCSWSAADLQTAAEGVALVINCTPLGMSPHHAASPWPEAAALPAGAFVYDMVYNPAVTRLMVQAEAAGLRAATGLGMLVEQGALAFELWTGRPAPRTVMRQAAEAALAARKEA